MRGGHSQTSGRIKLKFGDPEPRRTLFPPPSGPVSSGSQLGTCPQGLRAMEPPVVLPPPPVEFHINYNTKTVPKHQTQRTPRFQGRGGVLGWAGQHQESRPAAPSTALHSWASHLAPRRALPLPFLSISSLNVAKQENFCSNNTEVSLPRVTLAGVSRTFKFFSLKPQHW